MYRAEMSLIIFKIVGIWPPKPDQRFFVIYKIFSSFIACLMFLFTTSITLYVVRGNYDFDQFSENVFYVIGLSTSCAKMIVIFQNQNKLFKITLLLLNKNYAPRDETECLIQNKYDKIGRMETTIYVSNVFIALALKIILTLIFGHKTLLPFNAWVPYNLEIRSLFWLTFIAQSFGIIVAGSAAVAVDTFVVVMMLQLCVQMEILTHRMQIFPKLCKTHDEDQKIILRQWIDHHDSLYHFRNELNQVFSLIFLFQLFGTTLEVCTSTYSLSTCNITSVKFWAIVVSLSCVMFQICIYCWHGNMVITKSIEIGTAIFHTDWISLTRNSRTSLIQIIRRSNKPIQLTAGPVFSLSIDTFNKILRLSYSIYNFYK